MRNRRIHRGIDEKKESKRLMYISALIFAIAIITFVVTYIIYSNNLSKNMRLSEIEKLTEYTNMENQIATETNKPIGKTVNEINNEQINEKDTKRENEEDNSNNNATEKIAINTSNINKDKKENESNAVDFEKDDNKIETNASEIEDSKEEVNDPTFVKPVDGKIIREFAKDSLLYSETLKEWVTHMGVDISAEKTTIVKAAADGRVKSIKTDPRYGITVVIEHANGFTSVYSNLMTAEFVKENEEIKQGQTIGTVGNTATFEILDESHLHFEILKDNEYLNPCDYI